jgi:hypothetical protein
MVRKLMRAGDLCSDCPPAGYPTDKTRCAECPRRSPDTRQPPGNLDLIIAYEDDEARILEYVKRKDLAGLISWLERGRKPTDVGPPRKVQFN